MCIKNKDSFLKNRFTMLNGFEEGQNLSGWFCSSHFFVLSVNKKRTHLNKDRKKVLFLSFCSFNTQLKKKQDYFVLTPSIYILLTKPVMILRSCRYCLSKILILSKMLRFFSFHLIQEKTDEKVLVSRVEPMDCFT